METKYSLLRNLAKQLCVRVDDIKRKCILEGIAEHNLFDTNITHGLQETIKDWFGGNKRKTSVEISRAEHINNMKQIEKDFLPLLKKDEFEYADKCLLNTYNIEDKIGVLKISDHYTKIKSVCIKSFFNNHFNLDIDSEQSEALADIADNILVTARAGSGKTRTLTAKAILLATKYNIDPNHILLLAFNRDAAREIKIRLKQMCPDKSFNNVRTFHSLACGILERVNIEENPDRFVHAAIKQIHNKNDLMKRLYQYFKNDVASIKNGLTSEEYKRIKDQGSDIIDGNRVYISLNGQYVKSRGEKWIADFFFEHNLSCDGIKVYDKYEKPLRTKSKDSIIKPDFTLECNGKWYFIEHWAINDTFRNINECIWKGGMTFTQYDIIRKRKKKEYEEGKLIETFPKDMESGRNKFEEILKERLEQKGIQCTKKDEQTLLDNAYNKLENRIKRLVLTFIRRCAQKKWDIETVQKKLHNHKCDETEKTFLDLAIEVYKTYLDNFKRAENGELENYDYSMLLPEATKKIPEGETLKLKYYEEIENNAKDDIPVKDIKYILIDEYQDFSTLFYDFIKKIKEYTNAKLFCVGDDWQAINGFAGSDLCYFKDFASHFSPHSKCNIVKNYRSGSRIVKAGNSLMRTGKKAKPSSKEEGVIQKIHIDDYYVNYETGGSEEDEKYKIRYNSGNAIDTKASMLLKAIHTILSYPENAQILKTAKRDADDIKCMILTRTNYLYSFGKPIGSDDDSHNDYTKEDKLIENLLDCFIKCKQFDESEKGELRNKFARKTVHKAKGQEADIVIVVNCCERTFPMLHPDNQLFRIFGVTDESVLEEECRLFYVAITRAKKRLYLLTEKNRESYFLKS